uniref:Uncharacterized protein n=1 Tax=Oryza nivara TaxID=4536 RepID=A0A0E0FIC8_ORYNI
MALPASLGTAVSATTSPPFAATTPAAVRRHHSAAGRRQPRRWAPLGAAGTRRPTAATKL